MVEVDPRLFVTCRLCLVVQGHFQIDPMVQQQIKYCFDIDVEPFDRLPQLICKKCQNILKEHYEIKKNFNEKQNELKSKLQVNAKTDASDSSTNETKCNESSAQRLQESDSDSNSSIENVIKRKKKHKIKKVKKRKFVNRLVSSSSNNSDTESSVQTKQQDKSDPNVKPWDENLNKYFVCRICSQGFKDRSDIIKHTNEHGYIQKKYKNVFKMSCLVVMEKSDGKPNICNSSKSVVYSSDCVIQNQHNPLYYVVYHPKTFSLNSNDYEKMSLKKKMSDSESTEINATTTLVRKRRRLSSRSSSETIVLNQNSEHEDISQNAVVEDVIPPTIIDCIDLDDSSDNASYESNEKSITLNKTVDSKSTYNIIKMCYNRYVKKIDCLGKKTSHKIRIQEELLQHKVLSIGRKIINSKGFNCTGLLRFLEYKALGVSWQETSILKDNSDGKYVRIATRMKGYETSDPNNLGWKNGNSVTSDYEESNNSINILKKIKQISNIKFLNGSKSKPIMNEEITEQLPRISSVFSHNDLEITKTDSETMLQKLLNKTPVLNPKQLPKKVNSIDCSVKSMRVFSAPTCTAAPISVIQTDENSEINSNSMPIVMSSVSLAPLSDKDKNNIIPAEDNAMTSKNMGQSSYPRIKVKPVSELMPEGTTSYVNSKEISSNDQNELPCNKSSHNVVKVSNWYQTSNIAWNARKNTQQNWTNQNPLTEQQIWPNKNVSLTQTESLYNPIVVKSGQHNFANEEQNTISSKDENSTGANKERIVLDTAEFPNTRTSSPFQYLKNLLLVHNITLVDADKSIPPGSKCLIKLKLVYQQEACDPLTLCLSLYCNKNVFCMKVRDKGERDVNVLNLTANWQWQLLKIYSDTIVEKVLQTASKISVETHQYTKHFFTLLKSIKFSDVT